MVSKSYIFLLLFLTCMVICLISGGHDKMLSETSRRMSRSPSEKYKRVKCTVSLVQWFGCYSQIHCRCLVNILIKTEVTDTKIFTMILPRISNDNQIVFRETVHFTCCVQDILLPMCWCTVCVAWILDDVKCDTWRDSINQEKNQKYKFKIDVLNRNWI